MGEIHQPEPVLRLLAAFSRHDDALQWAEQKAADAWGDFAKASTRFQFDETDYYEATMGKGLHKQFWACGQLSDPADLAEWKLQTNQWEQEYAQASSHTDPRPLNLDPGYVTRGKLVLASTKDHAHRIYLCEGVYAEVTIYYRDKRWQPREWTYPDFRREDYHEFFTSCRDLLRKCLQQETGA